MRKWDTQPLGIEEKGEGEDGMEMGGDGDLNSQFNYSTIIDLFFDSKSISNQAKKVSPYLIKSIAF